MSKKRLSHDQKRKQKLKQRAERTGRAESLAYTGNRWRGSEFVPVMLATETGVREADVISRFALTDADVAAALTQLIQDLRKGPLPDEFEAPADDAGSELVVCRVRKQWAHLADNDALPGRDDLIGVLRTLIGSVENRHSHSLSARGYLKFLEGFLAQAGGIVISPAS